MTEKPFADTVEHAREMLQLSAAAGRRLMISQNYRYHAPFVQARKMVAEQAIGELGSGHIDFYIAPAFADTFRGKMDFPLLVDMAIHHLDLIRYVTRRYIVKVTIPPIEFTGRDATLHEFAETIRTGRPSELDGAGNLWSFGAVVAGVENARTGRTTDVSQIIQDTT
jgi:hypothetical protein